MTGLCLSAFFEAVAISNAQVNGLKDRKRDIPHTMSSLMSVSVDCGNSALLDGAICDRELGLIYTQSLFDRASARSLG